MKKMIKSALVAVAAAVIGFSAWAVDQDVTTNVLMQKNTTTNVLAELNVQNAETGDWIIWSSDTNIVTAAWTTVDGLVTTNAVQLTAKSEGSAEVIVRSPTNDTYKLPAEFAFEVFVSTVEIEKSIKMSDNKNDKSNATIRVVTHVNCGDTNRTSRTLFLGSLCGSHGLSNDTIRVALQAIADYSDVDWFFFDNERDSAENVACTASGSFEKGSTVSGLPDVSAASGTHCNLKAYLSAITNYLDIASENYKRYDYIVLEFDNNRLASRYNDADEDLTELEDCAARCLKRFYEKKLVTWITDNGQGHSGDDAPFYGTAQWYTPSGYRKGTDGGEMTIGSRAWNGFVALLDPITYFAKPYGERSVGRTATGNHEYLNRIASQAVYLHAEDVTAEIKTHMKFASFAMQVKDTVIRANGTLDLAGVSLWEWTGAEDPVRSGDEFFADSDCWKPIDWKSDRNIILDIPSTNDHQVICTVSNLNGNVWRKLEIKVRATDQFVQAAMDDAKGAQTFCKFEDGKYKVNPNDGEAKLTIDRSIGWEDTTVCAAGTAAAENAWELPPERVMFPVDIIVHDGAKDLWAEDPSYIATNYSVIVRDTNFDPSDIKGYCVRTKGEAPGQYAINFICTKWPGYESNPDGYKWSDLDILEPIVWQGTFTIRDPEMKPGSGAVTYPATVKVSGWDTGLLKEKANATWSAKADMGCVFAGWVAAAGAPECVTNHLAAFSRNELKNVKLTFKVAEGEKIKPTDIEATWVRIDQDAIKGVFINTNGLFVVTRSYVTASVSGLPSGLKFNAKTLAVSGAVTAKDGTNIVKVAVKNASGYSWNENFAFVVSNKTVTPILSDVKSVQTKGVSVMLCCDPKKGTVKGTGVYAIGTNETKKIQIDAKPAAGYMFAGWYLDPGFENKAYEYGLDLFSNWDSRQASQTLVIDGRTDERIYLFARFVEKSADADPIVWLHYKTAAYANNASKVLVWEDTEVWMQGVALPTNGCQIAFDSLSMPKVTVKGLPAGVKFDKLTNHFTGIPTKAGTYTVEITVKNESTASDVIKHTVVVLPLPAWAVGNFSGTISGVDQDSGTAQMTVSSVGKVSGKIAQNGVNWTYSANSYADWSVSENGETNIFKVVATAKSGKMTRDVEIFVAAQAPRAENYRISEAVAEGKFGDYDLDFLRIVWKDEGAKALLGEYGGSYGFVAEEGDGFLIKLAATGKATIAGKTEAGRKISLSTDALTDLGGEVEGCEGCYAMLLKAPFYAPAEKKTYTNQFFRIPVLCNDSSAAMVTNHVAVRQPGAIAMVARANDEYTENMYLGFGSVNVSPAFGQVASNKVVTFTATPDKTSAFAKWVYEDCQGNIVGSCYDKTLKLTADGANDFCVKAVFTDKYSEEVVYPDVLNYESITNAFANLEKGVPVAIQIEIPDAARPATFAAKNLPSGLKLDSVTGMITGTPTKIESKTGTKAVIITVTGGGHVMKPKVVTPAFAGVVSLQIPD